MGCCLSASKVANSSSQPSIKTHPSGWTQQQIIKWLQQTRNGQLSDLIKPFKKHKISGLVFINLTQDELQNQLNITEFGLVKEFILLRDKLISDYKQQRLDTLSTTQSNTNSNKTPNTPSSSAHKSMQHCLLNQIQHNDNNNNNNNNNNNDNEENEEINDERETSPLLPMAETVTMTLTRINTNTNTITNTNTNTNTNNNNNNNNNKYIDDDYKIDADEPDENEQDDDDKDDEDEEEEDEEDEEDDEDDEDKYDVAVITDDDCYIEPLVAPRFSVRTNITNATTITNGESESNGRQRMLAAYHHGWKNVSTHCDDEFITVNDLKWKKIRNIAVNNVMSEISEISAIYNYSFMEQYADISYIGGCKLVIKGCLDALSLLIGATSIADNIYNLCFKYYFEIEKHVFQFGYDIWKILYRINKKEIINDEIIKSFVGDILVIETRKKYWNKYRFGNTISYCNDLLHYEYIKLIAKREGAEKVLNPYQEYKNDNKYLYKFDVTKKREFKKYYNFISSALDRNSWSRGSEVEIYSQSLDGWQLGEIIKIGTNHDTVVVSYDGGNDSKYLLKTVKRNDMKLVRSTRDYITNRNKWSIGREIEIFSNSEQLWCSAIIEAIIPKDTNNTVIDSFRVKYKKRLDSSYYTKRIDHWSCDCRDIQIITDKELIKYKVAKQCLVWSDDDKKWIIYNIKDIIPRHKYVVVQKEEFGPERIIDINSGCIKHINL